MTLNTCQTAEEVAAGTSIKLETIQNVLAAMHEETPPPLAVQGIGTKSDPGRYRALSPHFEGFQPVERRDH
jgi:hypothetical protein